MEATTIDLVTVADRLVRVHLGVRPGEEVLLVADPESELGMAYALAGAVQAAGGEYTLALMPSRLERRATELTRVLERGLAGADVLVGLTRASGAPTYARPVAEALQAGRLRALSMVMRPLHNWTRGAATADYEALDALGRGAAATWAAADALHVASAAGTDFRAGVTKEPVMGQVVIVECGIARQPGREAAFSDGEVSQRPRAGSARGHLVVDGPMARLGAGDRIELDVEDGKVVRVTGGDRARHLEQLLQVVPGLDHVAEVGIGVNASALRNGDFEEEKKAEGNVHVALGDDVFYGGDHTCALHLDMVIRAPDVTLDDRPFVSKGRLVR
ncbi:MAG: aminopeptidase [Deinococcales bacterium]